MQTCRKTKTIGIMSNVTITFPICLEALFFKDLGSGKYLKEISGCENVCIETIHNNLEIRVPCDINGHLSYFVFLVPTKIFGNKPVDLVTFFKKGLCKIEENPFSLGLHVPGFFEKIIDVDDCKLQSELSDEILNFSRNFFREKNLSVYNTKSHSGYLRFLIIRQSRNTNHLMVNLITYDSNEPLMEEYASEMKKLFPQVTTLVNSFSTKKAMVAVSESSTALYGDGYIIEKLNNGKREISFKISPNSFFQTNTRQTEKLYKVMMDFADFSADDSVYDLYCGAGAISLFISDFVKSVTGVELVGDAIENAKENAVLNNIINVKFVLNDIKDYLKSISGSIESGHNKLILDPPRSGLHPDICKMLSETNFEKILYISCNPVTQARDIKMICEKGKYRIEKMKPVDMFPQTSHVENVCCLIPGENLKKIN